MGGFWKEKDCVYPAFVGLEKYEGNLQIVRAFGELEKKIKWGWIWDVLSVDRLRVSILPSLIA
tara:strand:+ start:2678 stop:2866 length:189 start_codon:yes stop_codon:yes gene_type:complete